MRRNLSLMVVASLLAFPLLGHDTWIAPERFSVRRGNAIELHMTSGMAFPKLDTAIKPERVARSLIRVAGQTLTMVPFGRGPHSLDFRIPNRATGIATIAVELKPNAIELTPAQVNEYLDEIGAEPELRRQWAEQPEPKRWREVYTKYAKSFVLLESPDDSWRQPMGLGLEFVPLSKPTSLRAGETFPVRLIENGKPLANFAVGVVSESDQGTILRTDNDGRVEVPLPRSGRYMVRATHLRRAQRSDADWTSDFTTLTLAVK